MSDPEFGLSSETSGSWVVYRRDDNGNTFLVKEHLCKEEAERLVLLFEARGHKQIYWAQEE